VKFLPGVNTKMILAFFGGLAMVFHWIKMEGIYVSKEFFTAVFIALIFSGICYYSVVYVNETNNFDYVSYVVSMFVWYSGAYFLCTAIAYINGKIDIPSVVKLLTTVTVAQCFIALLIEFIPAVKSFVDNVLFTGNQRMNELDRLYGIGAELDVAGVKFASVLVMIAIILSESDFIKSKRGLSTFYIVSFLIISLIGNMIARTTSLGMLIGVGYVTLKTGFWSGFFSYLNARLWLRTVIVGVIILGVVTTLYNSYYEFYSLFRFAFEGFFNWVETGEWQTASTEVLKNMWVYPDNLKTWIIGDGYFLDPYNSALYYMQTDVGYLRFIFYCGLVGLSVFCIFFIYLSLSIYARFTKYKILFLLLLVVVFGNWIKVATDIFVVYAIFLAMISPYISKNYLVEDD